MKKKIIVLLMGLVLGSNVYSSEGQLFSKDKIVKGLFIGGKIAAYLLYAASIYTATVSIVIFGRGTQELIETESQKSLLTYISEKEKYYWLKELIKKSINAKEALFVYSPAFALASVGCYKIACAIHNELQKNSDNQQKKNQEV